MSFSLFSCFVPSDRHVDRVTAWTKIFDYALDRAQDDEDDDDDSDESPQTQIPIVDFAFSNSGLQMDIYKEFRLFSHDIDEGMIEATPFRGLDMQYDDEDYGIPLRLDGRPLSPVSLRALLIAASPHTKTVPNPSFPPPGSVQDIRLTFDGRQQWRKSDGRILWPLLHAFADVFITLEPLGSKGKRTLLQDIVYMDLKTRDEWGQDTFGKLATVRLLLLHSPRSFNDI